MVLYNREYPLGRLAGLSLGRAAIVCLFVVLIHPASEADIRSSIVAVTTQERLSLEPAEKTVEGENGWVTFGPPNKRRRYEKIGTGFVVSSGGLILTALHNIRPLHVDRHVPVLRARVLFYEDLENLEWTDADVVGAFPYFDLAILKVTTDKTFTPLILGDSESLAKRLAQQSGTAFDMTFFGHPDMSEGFVPKNEKLNDYRNGWLVAEEALQKTYSGGPAINGNGEAIGVAIFSGITDWSGVLPIHIAKDLIARFQLDSFATYVARDLDWDAWILSDVDQSNHLRRKLYISYKKMIDEQHRPLTINVKINPIVMPDTPQSVGLTEGRASFERESLVFRYNNVEIEGVVEDILELKDFEIRMLRTICKFKKERNADLRSKHFGGALLELTPNFGDDNTTVVKRIWVPIAITDDMISDERCEG